MFRTARRRIIGVLFLAAWTGLGALAQQASAPAFKDTTALPEGQAGARIKSLLEVLNSGSVDRIKRFIGEECAGNFRDRIPLEEHISTLLGFLRDTGGVDFHSVRTFTPERPGATVVIIKDRVMGGWWGLSVRFGEAPKLFVNGLGIGPARPPAGIAEPPLTEEGGRRRDPGPPGERQEEGLVLGDRSRRQGSGRPADRFRRGGEQGLPCSQ
jgi:hypothetical protein